MPSGHGNARPTEKFETLGATSDSSTAAVNVQNNITSGAPAGTDDGTKGYSRGSWWVDTAVPAIHFLLDPATNAAIWVKNQVTTLIAANGIGITESPAGTYTVEVDEAIIELQPFGGGDNVTTGDQAGGLVFRVPAHLDGWDLVEVAACHVAAGSGGSATSIQIHNITQAADMLQTALTIDVGELDSKDATAAAAIDTANDDVATGDQIRVDVDATNTTPPTGLVQMLRFKKP